MDPYCLVTIGDRSMKGSVCKKGGKHPVWDEVMAFKTTNEPVCVLELMDKDTLTADDMIGVCEIDMQESIEEGRMAKWYELHYKRKLAGEILVETIYTKDQYSEDSIVNFGTREIRNGTMRARTGQKAAAKNIIGYVERKPRQSKEEKAKNSTFESTSYCSEYEALLDLTTI
jgi:hypothetical protein